MCPGNARKVFVDCRNVEHFAVVAFFLRGEFSLRNLRTGQQKRMLLLFFSIGTKNKSSIGRVLIVLHMSKIKMTLTYRLNYQFG